MRELEQTSDSGGHVPVMLPEVLETLAPADDETYLDATFGAGGYTRALLNAAQCTVIAIDRDPNVVMLAEALARDFPGRFLFCSGCFSDMVALLAAHGIESIDGVVMDLGVSSMQIDQAERGFSFQKDGPLDMRMAGENGDAVATRSASELVNTLPEKELADLIYLYGEERASRRIAKAIVAARNEQPIERTLQLSEIVSKAIGNKGGKTDPATKTFQALRIAVNDELGEVQRGLEAAKSLLKPGGRLVVVTFHSLEDRIVKRFFKDHSEQTGGGVSRHLPDMPANENVLELALINKKAMLASDEESRANPRARSAKLRAARKLEVAA